MICQAELKDPLNLKKLKSCELKIFSYTFILEHPVIKSRETTLLKWDFYCQSRFQFNSVTLFPLTLAACRKASTTT